MSVTLPDYLAIEGQRGCRWSTEELFRYHHRMIRLLAGKAMGAAQSHDRDDLESEVRLAMLELLRSWKHGAGCSFATYCFNWIPLRLRRRLDGVDYIVKVPAYAGLKDRRESNQAIPFSTTLYAPSMDGEEVLREDVEQSGNPLQPDYEARSDMAWLLKSIDKLPERERAALRATYFDEGTQDTLAAAWGCTRQNVSQYARTGVGRLRRMAKAAL